MPPPRAPSWGIVTRHATTGGGRLSASARTLRALLGALGAEGEEPPGAESAPLVVMRGDQPQVGGVAEVALEGGGERGCRGRLPADLPLGYHTLHAGGRARRLIVTPARCHLPEGGRGFVLAVQLHATRSARSWGIGDLGDLAELGRWAGGLGAAGLVVSPLHATLPLAPVEASPYFPTSRVFLNPLLLRPEPTGDLPIADLEVRALRLNGDRAIHRDEAVSLKMRALERAFSTQGAEAEASRALREEPLLADFALFCALAERHGRDWREWPGPLARREPTALAAAERDLRGRVRLHAFMQAVLDRQLREAAATLPLILDLAVGVHPGGADAWVWQDLLAPGVSVGAPPDTFNSRGQDWGVPAFDPWKLRGAAYAPFIATLRAALRHGAGLRIDHVMGLERLWWIPAGHGPEEGAYVRYPLDDLLGIVALESVRHRATVIGEDLGTVPRGLRARLRRRGLLGYVLLLFEDRPPRRWPRQAVAAVTTHDLPTIAGLWDGSDVAERRRLGLPADAAASEALARRLARGAPNGVDLDRSASVPAAIEHAHRRLASSPCMLVSATLEDVAQVRERPNQPGLIGPPSWSLALPLPLEQVEALPMATRLAELLGRNP